MTSTASTSVSPGATVAAAGHRVVDARQWRAERVALQAREKELTRLRDRLAEARRALPWLRVDEAPVFDTPDGPRRLGELFEGRPQLLMQHFMFAPGWGEGCRSCSYMADHLDGAAPHLAARDTALVVVSRAPLAEIQAFRRRMGWRFRWVSSHGSDFNRDIGVSFTADELASGRADYNFGQTKADCEEMPGISVFWRDADGGIYRTYSTYGRGVEVMMGTYPLLDLTPLGRHEDGLPDTMAWVRHHDRYEPAPAERGGAAAGGGCAAHGR